MFKFNLSLLRLRLPIPEKDKKEGLSLLIVTGSPSLLSLNGRSHAEAERPGSAPAFFLRCTMLLQDDVVNHKADNCPDDGRDHPA
jgi:hypothetical protein